MKSKLFGLALALSVLAFVGMAVAQSTYVVANVPFSFVVNGTTMPAGSYRLMQTDEHRILIIKGPAEAFVHEIPAEALDPAAQTELVFQRYGDTYVLSQVWRAGETDGVEIPMAETSKAMLADKAGEVTVIPGN
jgi:hypothetical protein